MPTGEDQNGVHVNGNDPSDIAWGIKEVLRNPERAKKWGENGRKRVIQYFTWRKAAEQTLQIYEQMGITSSWARRGVSKPKSSDS